MLLVSFGRCVIRGSGCPSAFRPFLVSRCVSWPSQLLRAFKTLALRGSGDTYWVLWFSLHTLPSLHFLTRNVPTIIIVIIFIIMILY